MFFTDMEKRLLFALVLCAVLVILVLFPQISMFLPNLIFR